MKGYKELAAEFISKWVLQVFLGALIFVIYLFYVAEGNAHEFGLFSKLKIFLIITAIAIILQKVKKWIISKIYDINKRVRKKNRIHISDALSMTALSDDCYYCGRVNYTISLKELVEACGSNKTVGGELELSNLRKKVIKKMGICDLAILEGKPGYGKTYILNSLFRYCHSRLEKGKDAYIPLFIEGRYISADMLRRNNGIMSGFLADYFRQFESSSTSDLIQILEKEYENLRFLILVDDIDQVRSIRCYGDFLFDFARMIVKDAKIRKKNKSYIYWDDTNRYVFSSRAKGVFAGCHGELNEVFNASYFKISALQNAETLTHLRDFMDLSKERMVFATNPGFISIAKKNNLSKAEFSKVFEFWLDIDLARVPPRPPKGESAGGVFLNKSFIIKFIIPFSKEWKSKEFENTDKSKLCMLEQYLRNGFCSFLFNRKNEKDGTIVEDGYLSYIYKSRRNYKDIRKGYEGSLCKCWGEDALKEFKNYLKKKKKDKNIEYPEFENSAIECVYVQYKAVIKSLAEGNIIETDESGFLVKKFKNYWLHKYYLGG